MNKNCKIFFWADEVKEDYLKLKQGRTPAQVVYTELEKAFIAIGNNAFCGRQVKKEEIPRKYREFDNLWIYNLSSSKRLIYSVGSDDDGQIIAVICEWFGTHKEYDKVFGHSIS